MLTFILLLWLLVPAVNIYIDRNGKKPHYLFVFGVRGFVALGHAILLDLVCNYFPDQVQWDWSESWTMLRMWLPILLFQVTSFWILFELGLNIVRGRELLYFDRYERDSGWIDKLFDKLGTGAHLAAKILALFVMVRSIVSLYNQVP
jgi:hypothetical protein